MTNSIEKYLNKRPLTKRDREIYSLKAYVVTKSKYSYPSIGKRVSSNNLFYNLIVKSECVNIPLKKIRQ